MGKRSGNGWAAGTHRIWSCRGGPMLKNNPKFKELLVNVLLKIKKVRMPLDVTYCRLTSNSPALPDVDLAQDYASPLLRREGKVFELNNAWLGVWRGTWDTLTCRYVGWRYLYLGILPWGYIFVPVIPAAAASAITSGPLSSLRSLQ